MAWDVEVDQEIETGWKSVANFYGDGVESLEIFGSTE
jgi:hypothetical protein